MATYTTNFNLAKPEQNEAVDVDVLNNNSDIIDDNLGQAKQLASNVGYEYNNAVPYYIGDYCIYEDKLYKCVQNILIPEDFDITKWQQCTLAGEIGNIKGNPLGNVTGTLSTLQIGDNIYQIEEGANDNIADAYDATSTYNVGDYVIYHSVLYKCTTAVSSAEPFDDTKWTSCLVTDEMGQGGGGSGGHIILDNDGTALTQRDEMQFVGTYSEDDSTNEITKVNIVREMTKAEFDLLSDDEKTGIINVTDEAGTASVINGVFIDTDNVIVAETTFTISLSYIATQDCYVSLYLVNADSINSVIIKINTKKVYAPWYGSGQLGYGVLIPLKKGQTLTVENVHTSYQSNYTVYGIQQGSQETTKNEIYSTDERAVGTWIDGSTVYQKTVEFASELTVNSNSWTDTTISNSGMRLILNAIGYWNSNDGGACYPICATCDTGNYVKVLQTRNTAISLSGITIQYTKSTT